MKKTFTLALLCVVAFNLAASTSKVKLAYFNNTYRNYETNIPAPVDPILVLLQSDSNFEVTYIDYDAVGNTPASVTPIPTSLDEFDVIVSQESFTSGDSRIVTNGLLHLGTVNKPILFNKSYAFQSGRIFGGSNVGGGVHQLSSLNLKVDPANQSNDLFKGITFDSNGEFKIINENFGDNGEATMYVNGVATAGGAGINYVKANSGLLSVTNPNSSINQPLAIPAGYVDPATDADKLVLCFNDIPSGSTLGSASSNFTTNARVINIGLLYSAIIKPGNMTSAGLTLFRNSIYSLAGLTIPSTAVVASVNSVENNKFSYTTNDNQLQLHFGSVQKANVSLYNVSGVLVSQKSVDADMVNFSLDGINKGVYIVKVSGSELSGIQKIVLE